MKGLYNNQGRKSGGYRKTKFTIGNIVQPMERPNLSMPCFEGRHVECNHQDFFGREIKCECQCHQFFASKKG